MRPRNAPRNAPRIALLCPGPSLAAWPADAFDGFGLRLAVNRAAAVRACDWWVFRDEAAFERWAPLGRPRVFTGLTAAERLAADARFAGRLAGHDVRTDRDVAAGLGPPPSWATFTTCAALVLARALGAASVDVFGHDMAGDADCCGDAGGNRGPDRWAFERRLYEELARWLAAAGVGLTRHARPAGG